MFKRLPVIDEPDHTVPLSTADLVLLNNPESERATRLRCVARDVFTATRTLSCVALVPLRGIDPSLLIGNIAYALGEMQHKTALIEANLRTPKIGEIFGLPPGAAGLATMLDQRPVSGLYEINPWLTLIPAGEATGDITGLLNSPRLDGVVKSVVPKHTLTIVCCPPAEEFSDHTFIIPSCEGVIVVARKDNTRMAEVVALRHQIERLSKPLVFALLQTSKAGWR